MVIASQALKTGQLDQFEVVMERLKDHFKVILALDQVATHQEPSTFLNYFGINLCIFSRCIHIIFGISQILIQLKFRLLLLNELLMEHGAARVVGIFDILLLIILIFFKLFELLLVFGGGAHGRLFLGDLIVDGLNDLSFFAL